MPAPEHYSHAIQLRFGVYRPFDIILVHSFSRFARDNLAYAIAKQTLKKAGIGIQSISRHCRWMVRSCRETSFLRQRACRFIYVIVPSRKQHKTFALVI